jgi:hypothetical protein
MSKFRPYGPFEIPINEDEVDKKELNAFWKQIDEIYPGLPDAIGCYVFAIRFKNAASPWYVGKTERRSFKREAFELHKLGHYRNVLKIRKRGTPHLYLIAKLSPTGDHFRKPATKGEKSVKQLEELLIGSCLTKNPDLFNQSMTKFLRHLSVPGYMHDKRGARTLEARNLAKLLGKP